MNRPLSPPELQWLRQGLATLSTDQAHIYLQQLGHLRVVGQCSCADPRCHTIEFEHWHPDSVRTLVSTLTEDGRLLFVDVDLTGDRLLGLEII